MNQRTKYKKKHTRYKTDFRVEEYNKTPLCTPTQNSEYIDTPRINSRKNSSDTIFKF